MDDLYTARAANQQPAPAGCWVGGAQETRGRGRPLHCTGSQQAACSGKPLAGWMLWRTTSLDCHPTVGLRRLSGEDSRSSCADVLLYAGRSQAAGSGWLRAAVQSLRPPALPSVILPISRCMYMKSDIVYVRIWSKYTAIYCMYMHVLYVLHVFVCI